MREATSGRSIVMRVDVKLHLLSIRSSLPSFALRPSYILTSFCSSLSPVLPTSQFSYVLGKVGFKPGTVEFKIQNIIGTTDVGFPIRLEGVVLKHAKFASYEPELFPGLIYRMLEPKTVLLIFVSGKVVITGARSEESLAKAMEKVSEATSEASPEKFTVFILANSFLLVACCFCSSQIHPVLEEFRKSSLTAEEMQEAQRKAQEGEQNIAGMIESGDIQIPGDGA